MEKLHDIRGIFFDLGGTLLYPPSGSFMFSELAKRYFPPEKLDAMPPERVRAAKDRAYRERAVERSRPVLSTEEEYDVFLRYYTVLSDELGLGLKGEEIEAVARDKVYNKDGNSRLFDGAADTLKALQGRYKLGIISDTWPSIVPLLEHLGILKYFDCATFSFELGALKPDPGMFRDALSKMGLPPEQTVFIDDNPKNLAGAAALGIVPVLISAAQWSPRLDRDFGIDYIQAAGGIASAEASGPDIRRIDKISGLLELL